jgi:AcrR family transcriptional regulator
MPKVTEAHLEARRQQIVDAAAACFARRGFHRTTMQDICQMAELSPGAVYRYFDSKEAIIRSMVSQRQTESMALIEATARPERPTLEVLDELINIFFPLLENVEGCAVDLELWAEATHHAEIRKLMFEINVAMVEAFAAIIERAQERGEITPKVTPEAVAQIMCSWFQGLIQQKLINPAVNIDDYTRAMRSMMSGGFWVGEKEV